MGKIIWKKNGYMYSFNWITLLYTTETNNTGNQPYSNIKIKFKKPQNISHQEGERHTLTTIKTWIKETEDESKKWKDVPCSWTERIDIIKMAIVLIVLKVLWI